MQPENKQQIFDFVRRMSMGYFWEFRGSFRQFFPNPVWPEPDDHIEVPERAQRFFNPLGVTARENPDGTITIQKTAYTEQEQNQRINRLKRDMEH
jgi:hypothetical protein